jgi:flavin-binding protein dodecin
MADRVYRLTEIVGTSPDGLDAAIQTGIKRASSTLHGLDWFQVSDIRGQIVDGDVAHYQVTLKVGFRLDEPPAG